MKPTYKADGGARMDMHGLANRWQRPACAYEGERVERSPRYRDHDPVEAAELRSIRRTHRQAVRESNAARSSYVDLEWWL